MWKWNSAVGRQSSIDDVLLANPGPPVLRDPPRPGAPLGGRIRDRCGDSQGRCAEKRAPGSGLDAGPSPALGPRFATALPARNGRRPPFLSDDLIHPTSVDVPPAPDSAR